MEGYVKLYRQLRDHWIWTLKPFDQAHAWVDLLIRASWTERSIPHPSKIGPSNLGPGELICSKRGLSLAWGWSRKRVDRFIKRLADDAMIDATNDATYTRIKVLNWSRFQGLTAQEGATNDATKGATRVAMGVAMGVATLDATLDPHTRREEGKKEKEGEEAGAAAPPANGETSGATDGKAARELAPLFRYCKMPGLKAKADAIEDLIRTGVPYDRIASYARTEEARTSDFFATVRFLREEHHGRRNGTASPGGGRAPQGQRPLATDPIALSRGADITKFFSKDHHEKPKP